VTLEGREQRRLEEDDRREKNWKQWGPYLAGRQWGTVREDYSAEGDSWEYFPHEQARSRAYRWGEDGLLGITDRECRLCFAFALWNGKDPILKERLFGLTGPEGNHGEDVKECYYYLDSTPTHSYMRALYKYPQAQFPYRQLLEENRRRGRDAPEYELEDTGVFNEGKYFDVGVEYAKASPDDILIKVTVSNRGPAEASFHLLPTLWQRNTWSWGRVGEGYWPKGEIERFGEGVLVATHPSLGRYFFAVDSAADVSPQFLFTDNETNVQHLFGVNNSTPYVKDAFHRRVIGGEGGAVNPRGKGTKAAAWYSSRVPAGGEAIFRFRLSSVQERPVQAFGAGFEQIFATRRAEADAFYAARRNAPMTEDERRVARQADAGLLWSKQFYNYIVDHWLQGDPTQTSPPPARKSGRNSAWKHLHARDVLSMPDTWEYPWFAAWDLAFHCVAMARIDPGFAKSQLLLLSREWYMHPNGQLPAYEFAFGDVNPPVHAWAAWRVYQLSAEASGVKDRDFLERIFHKCLVNFTWWVNRKDIEGDNLFSGGFLGLDNIGVFDRSRPLPGGGKLEQSDATAWMAFYCTTMLAMALELANEDGVYADLASKFFEHFISIADAMNSLGGTGLWNEEDGFYYDQLWNDGRASPLRVRSMVGLIPLFAAESIDEEVLARHPLFHKRLQWILENEQTLVRNISLIRSDGKGERRLLAVPTREKLTRVLRYVLDEKEFLSPHGIRSLSRAYLEKPYETDLAGTHYEVRYAPSESDSGLFGGNSNWRGPVWFPLNYLLIEALKRHHHFYGDELKVECPVGSGHMATLLEVASDLEHRLATLFLPDAKGRRACHGDNRLYASDPHFRDLLLFHEYFDGETGKGLGASHQTGWTALAANLLERVSAVRER
jgi:hypothetical protein